MELTASVRAGSAELIGLLAASALSLALLYPIHLALNHICILHVRRYCSRKGIPITDWRCSPALDADGTKTEFTLIEVLSESASGRKLFRFNVWAFGIRTVSEVEYVTSISAHPPKG